MHQGKAVPIRGSVLENVGEYFEGADDGVNYVLDLSIARLKKIYRKRPAGQVHQGRADAHGGCHERYYADSGYGGQATCR
jgi:hypothetical protein